MKIPTIRQLPSGAWSCQLRINGQSISITDTDYDKVQAKAYAYKAGLIKEKKAPKQITVGQALDEYIESRQNLLSPATIRGYRTIQNTRFLDLQHYKMAALDAKTIQRAVNNECALCSPKTLKNAWMLISSAIVYSGGEKYTPQLKTVPPAEKKYLTPEQIPIFLAVIKGTDVEIAALLGLHSCRCSEILGLDWSNVDLENNTIKITTGVVLDEHRQMVEKDMPKNSSSVRVIPIFCAQLTEALTAVEDKSGKVVKFPRSQSIYCRVNKICKQNGLPEIGVHGLRHSFASLAYSLGLPAKITMALGGWADDQTMIKIYTHISQSDITRQVDKLNGFFET